MEQYVVEFPKLGLELNLTREAFMIGDFAVYWYAVLIAFGAILAVIYSVTQSKKYGVDSDKLIDLGIVGIVFGIIGARAYYVIFNIESFISGDSFWENFIDMVNIRDGGLAIYGGIILGPLAAFIMSRINKTRFLPCLDLAAGGFLIGQCIGRWGNFVNQEAFGCNTDSIFGMYSTKTEQYLESVGWDLFKQGIDVNPSEPVHPCFFYESMWCLVGFLIIILIYRKIRKFDGEVFLFYTAWYGLGRGFIEGLRTDSLMIGDFRVSQLLGFTVFAVSVAVIVYMRLRIANKRKENPDYMPLYVDTNESKAQFMEDDKTVLDKAEALISVADAALESAEAKISKLYYSDNDEIEVSCEDDAKMEEMASELADPIEILSGCSKFVDLAMQKLYTASELLERFGSDDAEKEEAAELELTDSVDENEETVEEDGDELVNAANDISERIASVREFSEELSEIVKTEKAKLEAEKEKEEIPVEDEEIHDTVSDEADEIDEPNPNQSK